MASTANHDHPSPTYQTIWIEDSGRVSCAEHAGHYLSSAIENHPKGAPKYVWTPLGTWERFDAETAREYNVVCDDCYGIFSGVGT